jgi:hypothetical protein
MARLPFARLIFGPALLALTMFLAMSVGSSGKMQLRNVDGGVDYYGRYANGLPSDPSYFPLAVWYESVLDQQNLDLDKDAGLNLYIALTTNSSLPLIQRNGMKAILQGDWLDNKTAINSPAVAGWLLADEMDMTKGPGEGFTLLKSALALFPNDRRLRYSNYGKGVMFWETDAEAEHFVNDFQEVASNDIYWFTDPNLSSKSEGGKLLNGGQPLTLTQARQASHYGLTVDRMRFLAKGQRPIWNFVEVGWPSNATEAQGARPIQPAEIRAAVWHSIIAGARGIVYFNHSFGGPNQTQHCLREPAYAAARAIVKSTNQLIKQLAPVLNAPFADGVVTASSSVRTMTKSYDAKYYVFAGSKENVASTATFSLADIDNAVATVIDENRTIAIANGRFSDSFEDGNAIHIYRIDNWSSVKNPI